MKKITFALTALLVSFAGFGQTTIDWSKIRNTPMTLSGYGIGDAYTKTESDARYFIAPTAQPAASLVGRYSIGSGVLQTITLGSGLSLDSSTGVLTASGGGSTGGISSLTCGTGLSGGTITATGTCAVLYGSTSTTAAAGNDSRITGAEQASNKGIANGYAGLNSSALLPATQHPALSGDCTTPAGSTVTTCTKSNGTPFNSLAFLGTINNFNWSGSPLAVTNGGTGLNSLGTLPAFNGSALTNVSAANVAGVTISGTPSVGQVPRASSSSTAVWGNLGVADVTGAAPITSPALLGIPTAATAATPDNSAQLATTAFVKAQGYITGAGAPVTSVAGRTGAITLSNSDIAGSASLNSPVFTGSPVAPTPLTADNSTALATTAYVKAQSYITAAGNAATATALAATPAQCSGGQFATGVAASGNANCSTPSGGGGTVTSLSAGDASINISSPTTTPVIIATGQNPGAFVTDAAGNTTDTTDAGLIIPHGTTSFATLVRKQATSTFYLRDNLPTVPTANTNIAAGIQATLDAAIPGANITGVNTIPVSAIPLVSGRPVLTIAAFGDSKIAFGCGSSTGSRNAYQSSRDPLNWITFLTGSQINYVCGLDASSLVPTLGNIAGYGGETAVTGATRIVAALASMNPKPDLVRLNEGTNDIRGSCATSGACATTVAATEAALSAQIDAVNAIGATAIMTSITPRNNTLAHGSSTNNNWTTLEAQGAAAVNAWIQDQARKGTRRIIAPDMVKAITDPATGLAIVPCLVDGLHETPLCAHAEANAILESLQLMLPQVTFRGFNPLDIYVATVNPYGNLLSNGNINGTAGTAGTGVTGTVTTGMAVERFAGSSISGVASIVTKQVGRSTQNLQQIALTSPGSGALTTLEGIRFRLNPSTMTANLQVNHWYQGQIYLETDSPTISGLNLGTYLDINDTGTNGNRVRAFDLYTPTTGATVAYPLTDAPYQVILRTPPMCLTTTTGLNFAFYMYANPTLAGSMTVRVGSMDFRELQTPPPITYTTGPDGTGSNSCPHS